MNLEKRKLDKAMSVLYNDWFMVSVCLSRSDAMHSKLLLRATLEDLPGVLGNRRTLTKYRREQGNMSLFLGNRGTKLY